MIADSSRPRVVLDGLAFVESRALARRPAVVRALGRGEIVAIDLDGRTRWSAPGAAGAGLVDRLAARRSAAGDRRGAAAAASPTGRCVRHADLTASRRPRLERDRRRRPRQHLPQRHRLRTSSPASTPSPGSSPWSPPDGTGPPGRRRASTSPTAWSSRRTTPRLVVAESFAGRLTAFDIAADGSLSNRRVWAERHRPRTASASTPRAPSGPGRRRRTRCRPAATATPAAPRCASARAARSSTASSSTGPRFSFALGGSERRTLFVVGQPWRGFEHVESLIAERTGQVLCIDVDTPAAETP